MTEPDAGVMSAFVARLDAGGGAFFAKGTPTTAPDAWTYRHEARVIKYVPMAPLPKWETNGGGWTFYGYSVVPGRHADFTLGSPDLGPVAEVLTLLSGTRWPAAVGKRPLRDRLAPFIPEGQGAALAGSALAHTDLGEGNILVDGGTARLVDWALSCPGPAWADAALWVPRLIAAGHQFREADALARLVPAYAKADPAALGTFARTIRAFWQHRAEEAPMPHRAVLLTAAVEWESCAA
ncbi:phosphotransferase [Streptomyces sp. NPDC002125]